MTPSTTKQRDELRGVGRAGSRTSRPVWTGRGCRVRVVVRPVDPGLRPHRVTPSTTKQHDKLRGGGLVGCQAG